MKPIKLYLAGSSYPPTPPFPNRLVSYAYPEQLQKWLDMHPNKEGNIMLDSGAFSAWNKGRNINIDEYISYAHEAVDKCGRNNKKIKVVNLDVIPGKVGETSLLGKSWNFEGGEVINKAARQGYKNMKVMIANGIIPIHVFHQGEKWKWLDRMLQDINYIGISPANDESIPSKYSWMYSVFNYLYRNNIKVDTHGFAVFGGTELKEFPWTSCDAMSPLLLAAYGKIMYPLGGFSKANFSEVSSVLVVSQKKGVEGRGDVSPEKLKSLKSDGYSFDDMQDYLIRVGINVRYILEFEKYINEYKKSVEFVPRRTLIKR